MSDATDLKDTTPNDTDRGSDHAARDTGRGEERSGGRRDRSREMLRKELERNLDEANGRTGGKPRDWEPADRPARAAREATAEPGSAGGEQQTPGIGHNSGDATPLDTSKPPARWKSAAKQHWSKLPPEVQEATTKGEIDSARGVEQIKQKYAQEDAAWAKHEPVLRAHGVSRAAAIENLLGWHQALARDPVRFFPELIKSLGPEVGQALLRHAQQLQAQQGSGGAQAQQASGAQQFDPRVIQQYVDQRVGALEQQQMEQQQARTNEILENWARGKKWYERVRAVMSDLLMPNPQTGRAIVPLKNGAVDLDESYRQACMIIPDVWAEVQAEERAAERQRHNDEVARKRYTSSSLTPRAPGGNNNIGGTKKRGGPTSVRQSLEAAMDELAGR